MEWWYSIVIGTVAYAYIQLFNYNVKGYNGESGDRTHAL